MCEYQGWTNYETWCVNLWFSNSEGDHDFWTEAAEEAADTSADRPTAEANLAARMKDSVSEYAASIRGPDTDQPWGLMADLLRSAIDEVNWREVAGHYLEEI